MSFNSKNESTRAFNHVGSTRVVYQHWLLRLLYKYGWVGLILLGCGSWLAVHYLNNRETNTQSAAVLELEQRVAKAKIDDNPAFRELSRRESMASEKVSVFVNADSGQRIARKNVFQPKVKAFLDSLPVDWGTTKVSDVLYFDGRFAFVMPVQPNGEPMPAATENTVFSRKWQLRVNERCTAEHAVYERQPAEFKLSTEEFFRLKVLGGDFSMMAQLRSDAGGDSSDRFSNLVNNDTSLVKYSLEPTSSEPGVKYVVRDFTHSMTVTSMKGPTETCLSRFAAWDAQQHSAELFPF